MVKFSDQLKKKSLELAEMGANSGLKVWAEKIWDQRDSIMLLLFRVFSAGPRTKTLKSKKGSFPDTGCIHAAIPKFV